MIYTDAQSAILEEIQNQPRARRGVMSDLVKRWPGDLDGVTDREYLAVPYRFTDGNYPEYAKNIVQNTMNTISNDHMGGCIRWVDDTENNNFQYWVNVINEGSGSGCWSSAGYLDNLYSQKLNLAPECLTADVIMHEFLHTMGILHEQSRPDRDSYVNIHWDRILGDSYSQFRKIDASDWYDMSSPYDIDSVMHYSYNAGRTPEAGAENLPVMTSVATGEPVQYPRAQTMSEIDAIQLAKMYKSFCPNFAHHTTTEVMKITTKPDEQDFTEYCRRVGDGIKPNPTSCEGFIQCAHGGLFAIPVACPSGLLWDKDMIVCNWAASVDCQVGPTTTEPVPKTTPSPITETTVEPDNFSEFCQGRPDGHYDHPHVHSSASACGKFIQCYSGRIFIMDCPAGLVFYETSLRCNVPNVWPSVTCVPEVTY